MSAKLDISIVVPVFQAEQSLKELYERIHETMTTSGFSYELLCVDDASTDKSWEVLKALNKSNPEQVRIIRFAKNYGQHNATLCGMRYANGTYVVTMDDDLQHRPEDIPQLIEAIEEKDAEVLYGISEEHRSGYRKAASRLWKFGAKSADNGMGSGSSFRVLRQNIVEKLRAHNHHVIYIDELLQWYTGDIETLKVTFDQRKHGDSNYTGVKLFFFMFNLSITYSAIPLKLMTFFGVFLSIVSALIGFYFIIKKMVYGINVEGYTSLIVAILFSTSVILICLGIVGQYLNKIYSALNNKPTYSIRERKL